VVGTNSNETLLATPWKKPVFLFKGGTDRKYVVISKEVGGVYVNCGKGAKEAET